jgi:hypothetical protein
MQLTKHYGCLFSGVNYNIWMIFCMVSGNDRPWQRDRASECNVESTHLEMVFKHIYLNILCGQYPPRFIIYLGYLFIFFSRLHIQHNRENINASMIIMNVK